MLDVEEKEDEEDEEKKKQKEEEERNNNDAKSAPVQEPTRAVRSKGKKLNGKKSRTSP